MKQPRTISTKPFEHAAMDYAFLRAEGIRHLERLTGQLWTDYNAHDPGITILEQVCYALTDLAHRIDYEIPDLLANGGAAPFASLVGPDQILTTEPVTLNDLRKLVIDIAGVKNAWIEPVARPQPALYFQPGDNTLSLHGDALAADPVDLKGLYRVLIEALDSGDVYRPTAIKIEAEEVAKGLYAHRGLCEDFQEIRVLEAEAIQVQARVEIAGVDEAETILLQIYQRLADHISPSARFHSLPQLLERGLRFDEIYTGPRLAHGFIDELELQQAQRRSVLRTSDMIREIMDVPGVRAIRTISMSAMGQEPEPWSLALDPGKAPKLDLSGSAITLERNRLPVGLDLTRVIDTYHKAIDASAAMRPPAADAGTPPRPRGRDRQVGKYHSIQHQFPATYGIGAIGLPASASPRRKAQAKQLQAYLMFFDQLLANYFAQLAHVKDLFSFSTSDAETYFAQALDDPTLGIATIMRSGSQPGTAGPPDFERRNRFLNHLLARFAESFTDYSLALYDLIADDDASAPEQAARDKQAFLRDYPQLSSGRGMAFNYLRPADASNLSGLERRICGKLGLDENKGEEFLLIEHILLRPMAEDDAQVTPLLANPRHTDPYSLQLSVVFPNWPARFANANFRAFIARTIREETPAHLIPAIRWLDPEAMAIFKTAYQDWAGKRRRYEPTKAGGQTLNSTTHIHLRDARDRLIDLLGIGQSYPLQDLNVPNEQLTVAFNVAAKIPVENSQKGVLYQLYFDGNLVERTEAEAVIAIEAQGDGKTIFLETDKIREDITFEIRVQKLPWRLFNVDSVLDTALNNGEFPHRLRQKFADDRDISFSDRITVEVVKSDHKWMVRDRFDDRTFIVKKQADYLSVYHLPRKQEANVYLHQRAAVKVGLDRTLNARILDLPLLDLSLTTRPDTAPRLAEYNATVEVEIENSQEGVHYQLVYFEGGKRPPPADAVRGRAKDEIGLSQGNMLGDLHNVQLHTHPVREDIDIYIRATRTFDEDAQHATQTDLLDLALPLKVRANPAVAISVDAQAILDYNQPATLLLGDAQSTVEYQLYQRQVLPGEYLAQAAKNSPPILTDEGQDIFVNAPAPITNWGELNGFVVVGLFQAEGGRRTITTDNLREDTLFVVRATKTDNRTSVQLAQVMPVLVRPDPMPAVSVEAPPPAVGAAGVVLVNGTQKGVMYQLRVGKAGKTLINSPGYHFEERGVAASRIEVDFKVDFDANPDNPDDRELRLPTWPLKSDANFNVLATKILTGVTAPLRKIATVAVEAAPPEETAGN